MGSSLLAPETSVLLDAALKLAPLQRAELAQQLLASVGTDETSSELDRQWACEIQRRWDAYERGEVQPIDWPIALAEARQLLAARRSA